MRIGCLTILSIPAALLALCVWGCFGIARHVIVAVDHIGDAGAGIAQTAGKLNGPDGTIAMADEDIGAAKSLIIHADLVARHEQQSLKTWDARGNEFFANINGGITDLRGTINASKKTVDAGTQLVLELRKTAQAVNDPEKGLPPILAESGAAVRDARAVVPEVKRTATATANMMEENAGTAKDARKVADHYEGIIDNPKTKPWYIKMLPVMLQDAVQAALEHWALAH
jgi:hypothetical protein